MAQLLLVTVTLPITATATAIPTTLFPECQADDFSPEETSRRGSGRREAVGLRTAN
ncbi:MAG: hypothetical protein AAGG51_13260 [Cyanobacteria bacterium P01_G01_bin.54]